MTVQSWKNHIRDLLHNMITCKGSVRKTCAGIDIRLSSEFVKKEVIGAKQSICVYDDSEKMLGFALCKRVPSCNTMYITLMASFQQGIGRHIVEYLYSLQHEKEKFIAVPSTDFALGFYLKMGFSLFDWSSLDSYVCSADETLTQTLCASLNDRHTRDKIRNTLYFRNWIVMTRKKSDGQSESPVTPLSLSAILDLIGSHRIFKQPSFTKKREYYQCKTNCTGLNGKQGCRSNCHHGRRQSRSAWS